MFVKPKDVVEKRYILLAAFLFYIHESDMYGRVSQLLSLH